MRTVITAFVFMCVSVMPAVCTCTVPRQSGSSKGWAKGASVTVYVSTSFSSSQQTDIMTAFGNWLVTGTAPPTPALLSL